MPHTPYKDESDSEEEEEEIAAVEMILETYFMHCDNTYNKLQTLCEHRLPLQLSQDAGPSCASQDMQICPSEEHGLGCQGHASLNRS